MNASATNGYVTVVAVFKYEQDKEYEMNKAKIPPIIHLKNKPDDEMLIGAYVEPLLYERFLNERTVQVDYEQAYDDLKACGFNTLLQTESALNREGNQVTLDIFEALSKRGMNFLFRDKEVVGINNLVTDKTEEELIAYFKKEYLPLDEKYSAFAGIHYIDEAGWKDWKRMREIHRAFKTVFPDKLFYVNVLPIYSPAWAFPNGPIYMPEADWWAPADNDYIRYYDSYMAETKPDLFSYDFYPCSKEYPNLLDGYFEQLHLSYKYSAEANIPLVCFIQNGSWDAFSRDTTDAEMRWLINTALAYNTKGICYFTYWSYIEENTGMCIDLQGNKTHKYELVQQYNKELKFFGKYILNSAFRGYVMTGVTPNGETPNAAERLTSFGSIVNPSEGNLFIGCFDYHENGKIKNMYIVVNNSTTQAVDEKIIFDKPHTFTRIHRDRAEEITTDSMEIKLSAGDAYILVEENWKLH